MTYAWSARSGVLTPAGATAGYANDDGPRADTVTVTATSGGVSASAAAEILVRNVPPSAAAGPDVSQFWGLPVSFAGSASDVSSADTTAGLTSRWTFGDGADASGLAVTHAYTAAGPYLAALTATDKDGDRGVDSVAVTIAKRATSLTYTGSGETFGSTIVSARLSDLVDAATSRLAGREVVFRIGTLTVTATTNGAGEAVVTARIPFLPGEHEVLVGFAGDGDYLAAENRGRMVVASTPGKVTGGSLRSRNHSGRGGFNIHSDGVATKGELQWQNGSVDFHASRLTALAVADDESYAWFAG